MKLLKVDYADSNIVEYSHSPRGMGRRRLVLLVQLPVLVPFNLLLIRISILRPGLLPPLLVLVGVLGVVWWV